jgi:hypothetical protein
MLPALQALRLNFNPFRLGIVNCACQVSIYFPSRLILELSESRDTYNTRSFKFSFTLEKWECFPQNEPLQAKDEY